MKILSLFDGISCGQCALKKNGISNYDYFASEINAKAIKVTEKNFPETKQLGDVVSLSDSINENFDLLIGGSPCQDLSRALANGKGLQGERSGLFFNYLKILNKVSPKYFLLENVKMKPEWEEQISKELGVKPIKINSNIFVAQNRERLYWTNIPFSEIPPEQIEKGKNILIKDIVYDDNYKIFSDPRISSTKIKTKNYVKWDMSGKKYWSQQDRAYYKDGKMCTLPKNNPANKLNIVLDYDKDIYRRCHAVEGERLQGLDDFYTDGVGLSNAQRLSLIGDGWTVDVIAHLLKNIK